jgi:hypothetical protein
LFFAAAPKEPLPLALLGAALLGWLAVLIPWRGGWRRLTPRQQQRGMYLALGAWAVTDLAVLLAWA